MKTNRGLRKLRLLVLGLGLGIACAAAQVPAHAQTFGGSLGALNNTPFDPSTWIPNKPFWQNSHDFHQTGVWPIVVGSKVRLTNRTDKTIYFSLAQNQNGKWSHLSLARGESRDFWAVNTVRRAGSSVSGARLNIDYDCSFLDGYQGKKYYLAGHEFMVATSNSATGGQPTQLVNDPRYVVAKEYYFAQSGTYLGLYSTQR